MRSDEFAQQTDRSTQLTVEFAMMSGIFAERTDEFAERTDGSAQRTVVFVTITDVFAL